MKSPQATASKSVTPTGFRNARYLILFVATFLVFLYSPVAQVLDSRFSLLLTESLLTYRTPDLKNYWIKDIDPAHMPSELDTRHLPSAYQLVSLNDKILYYYPHGSSFLSLPFVAGMRAFGWSVVDSYGAYSPRRETQEQLILAPFLMAIAACFFLRSAELVLPTSWSIVVALGATFGTQIWSTASRGLWSHTWEVLLTGILVVELLKVETGGKPPKPIWLASLLSWIFFVRPTGAVIVIGVTGYVFLTHRRQFKMYISVGAAWLIAFVAYSKSTFGRFLPPYYHRGFYLSRASLVRLAGDLVSPSRGLLVFVPITALIIFMTIHYWRQLRYRSLAILAISIIVAHLVVLSGDPIWYGGWCYGPRLSTDLVPWFCLLAILSLDVVRRYSDTAPGHNPLIVCACMLLLLGLTMNAIGALSLETMAWNAGPNLDARVWDWERPQFLAWIIEPRPQIP